MLLHQVGSETTQNAARAAADQDVNEMGTWGYSGRMSLHYILADFHYAVGRPNIKIT